MTIILMLTVLLIIITEFTHITDDNNIIWFIGNEITKFLGYKKDTRSVLYNTHINKKYVCKLSKFSPPILGGLKKSIKPNNLNKTICINEFGLYQLLSKSELKNPTITKFQNWLYEEALPSIRKTGNYISNIETINKKPKKQLQHVKNHSNDVIDALKNINTANIYQNKTDIKTAQELFNKHSFRLNNDDKHNHILYFYLTSYTYYIDNKVCLTCKIGYTSGDKLDKRTEGLINEYNCKFFLIDYKVIDNIQCEQRFHDYLKEKYTESTIDDIDKRELYVFTTELLNEFYKFPNFVCSSHLEVEQIKLKQQQETTKQQQETTKQQQETTKHMELQLRMKEIELQIMQFKKQDVNQIKKHMYTELTNKQTYIYKLYLDERTEYSKTHMHIYMLYDDFKIWFSNNDPNCKLPSNKAFAKGIGQYTNVEKVYVKYYNSSAGVKNMKIKI